eukprot:1897458-Rhodomonas_salina.1
MSSQLGIFAKRCALAVPMVVTFNDCFARCVCKYFCPVIQNAVSVYASLSSSGSSRETQACPRPRFNLLTLSAGRKLAAS